MLSKGSTSRVSALVALSAACLVSLATATGATAAWPTGGTLASGSTALSFQASSGTSEVSVSANGRFVVFRSNSDNLNETDAPNGGIFRKDLADDSAPIQVVVAYPETNPNCGPTRPSISGNGRYIAFSTGVDGLVPSDSNGRQDVFVRDMSKPLDDADAFDLVSAVNGSSSGASYTLPFPGTITPGDECLFGSKLTGNVGNAISNDGDRVLFTNNAFTNLNSPTVGNGTAPGQLWVRERSTNSTLLQTVISENVGSPDPLADAGDVGEPLADPGPFNDFTFAGEYESYEPRASISGDGSTIAWWGVWARSMVEFQAAEAWDPGTGGGPSIDEKYLMWKKVESGLDSIRRVGGLVDLDDPACDINADWVELSLEDPPINAVEAGCRGPLRAREGEQILGMGNVNLTYDGFKVFFNSNAELRGDPLTSIARPDVLVSDMSPGVSRKQGTHQLTYALLAEASPGRPSIEWFSASDDGNRVAIVTERSDFSGVSAITPTGTTPPLGNPRKRAWLIDGGCDGQVYNGTIEWIARPSTGDLQNGPSEARVNPESGIDAFGTRFAFASNATNLFTGHNGQAQAMAVTDSSAGCADTLDPTVRIVEPQTGATTADASIVIKHFVSDNSGDATCDIADGDSAPLNIGPNMVTVTCEDAAGNVGTDNVNVERDDVTGPTVTIVSPANGSTTGLSPTLDYTATDDSGAAPDCNLVDGSTLGPYSAGAQSVTVTCEDAAGNIGSATSNFTAAAGDAIAPTVTITAPANAAVTTTSPTLTFTVNDNVDPSPDCDRTSGSTLGPLAGGAASVTVTCEDASGNIGSATRNFTVDASAPVVTITAPGNGSTVTVAAPTLTFTVNDNIDGSPSCNRTTGSALGPFGNGAQSVTVSCTDDVGNTGSATSNFTVQLPTPPPPPPPPGNPPVTASMTLLTPTVKGTAASIALNANVAGSVSATGTAKLPKGKKLTLQKAGTGSATVTPGGTTTISFKLSSAAKKFLKKKKLTVTVTVTYTPNGAAPITQNVKLNFKPAKKKK